MNLETNKLKLYSSLISILRLRENALRDTLAIKNSEEFIESLRKNYLFISKEMMEYLYCRIFAKFDELENALFEYNQSQNMVKIRVFPKDGDVDSCYTEDTIEVIDDEKVPIKISSRTVKVLDGEEYARISNSTSYANSKAIEMIKIKSKEKKTDLYGVPLDDLLEKAGSIPKETIIYRREESLSEVNKIRSGEEDVDTYYIDTRSDVFSIEPTSIGVDSLRRKPLSYVKEQLPISVVNYLAAVSRKNELRHTNLRRAIGKEKVDKEIADFMVKLEEGGIKADKSDYLEPNQSTNSRNNGLHI